MGRLNNSITNGAGNIAGFIGEIIVADRMKAKRKSFKARHAKNIAKGKMSAAYWADKVKW